MKYGELLGGASFTFLFPNCIEIIYNYIEISLKLVINQLNLHATFPILNMFIDPAKEERSLNKMEKQ